MIDQIHQQLKDWIQAVLKKQTAVFLAPPGDGQREPGVRLYLLEMVPTAPPRGPKRPPLQISLRYLVTAFAEDPADSDGWLVELLLAAMEKPEWEVEPEPVPLAVWSAFGVAPRPSFVLRVPPLRRERPEKPAPLVHVPLVVRDALISSLRGVVLGPKDTPIMGARVELPALQLMTHTDSRGRFLFSAVPAEPRTKLLRVQAKGREVSVRTDVKSGPSDTVLIRLHGLEV